MFDIRKTKAVLWDLDDTLYSRLDAARRTFPGMFREHLYINRSEAFIAEAVDYVMAHVPRNSMIHEDAFRALLAKYPPDKPYIRSDCLAYYYDNMWKYAEVFPEQIETVKKLREMGIKNAIVTNAAPERLVSQRRKVEVLQLAGLFDAIVYSGEFGAAKPDRRIYDHTAALLGVKNEECVFVGDDPDSDIAGALGADMEAVWLDKWEYDGSFDGNPHLFRVASVKEYFVFE